MVALKVEALSLFGRQVLASNIPADFSCESLCRTFGRFGAISHVRAEYVSAKSRVVVVVTYNNEQSVGAAVEALQNSKMEVLSLIHI